MLRPHMALLWSAKSNWIRSYKHVAALPKPLSNNTQLPHYEQPLFLELFASFVARSAVQLKAGIVNLIPVCIKQTAR